MNHNYLYCILLILLIIKQYQLQYNYELNDQTPFNTKVLDLRTLNQNGKLGCSLLTRYNAYSYFAINNNNIYTKTLIDMDTMCQDIAECCNREKENCDFEIGIACTENSESDHIIKIIKINIRDKNDNYPSFSQKDKEIELSENLRTGFTISLPTATDNDFGTNRIETYKINRLEPLSFDEYFQLNVNKQLNSIKVDLKLKKQLDRESISKYSFELLAIDGSYLNPKTGSININIKVKDENDNMPQFSKTTYKKTVKEGTFSTIPILQLTATDPDENLNGKILYKFDPNNKNDDIIRDNFTINEDTGEIYLKRELDYEKQGSFKFTVIAINPTSAAANSLSTSSATVEISVENVYDEPLNINIDYLNNKNYSIVEENKSNCFVAFVTIKSKEADQFRLSIQCHLESFSDTLSLVEKSDGNYKLKTYEIRTVREIDRESLSKIKTKVTCKELTDSNVLWSSAIILILIEDQNDNAPSLTISGNKSVRENTPPGTTVLTINAQDKDNEENGTVTFSMEKSTSLSLEYLKIDEIHGIITVKAIIDCEVVFPPLTALSVTVTATDQGKIPKFTDLTFIIYVIDVNDNVPTFSSDQRLFYIPENKPEHSFVGEIEIKDRDVGDDIRLEFGSQNQGLLPFMIVKISKSLFYLNTTRSLDREKEDKFSFNVIASDGRGSKAHTITGSVVVEVEDVNDNLPIIIFPRQSNATHHVISCFEPKNFKFMTVSANDQDQSNKYNRLIYQLNSNNDIFDIGRHDGSIFTRRDLTLTDVGDYIITIVVSNDENSDMKSSVSVNINIKDSPAKSTGIKMENSNNNKLGSQSPGSYGSPEIIVLILIVIFVVFIIIIFVCFGLRHYNKEPICLHNLMDKCFHTDISQVESNVYSPTLKANMKNDLDCYKDTHQKSTIVREPSNNWSHPNQLGTYNIAINSNQYTKPGYTKLSNSSQYYIHPHTYQTIEDSMMKYPELNKTMFSLQHRGKCEPNYKSEMNLNTDNLFYDQNQELNPNKEQPKHWIASLTPMPTRSKSVINRVIPNEQVESNFAVVYPQEQSTFV